MTQPFSFVAGSSVDLKVMRAQPEIAGALVTGLGGPQAPPALSTAVIGMKKGGKVRWRCLYRATRPALHDTAWLDILLT